MPESDLRGARYVLRLCICFTFLQGLLMYESLVVPGKAGRYLREVDVHAVYKDGANLTPVVIHLGAIRDHELSIAED